VLPGGGDGNLRNPASHEARTLVSLATTQAVQEQYRQYVRQLSPEQAGQLELGPDDQPITERARLKVAAQAEGLTLYILRQGNRSVFWETKEVPKPAADGRRKRK
jgi:hypothetical protein